MSWIIKQATTLTRTMHVDRDLTGATVYFTAKKRPDAILDDSSAIIRKDIVEHVDAANGDTVLNLTVDDTNVAPGRYKADFRIVFADGSVMQTDVFPLQIIDGVTNRG